MKGKNSTSPEHQHIAHNQDQTVRKKKNEISFLASVFRCERAPPFSTHIPLFSNSHFHFEPSLDSTMDAIFVLTAQYRASPQRAWPLLCRTRACFR